MNKHLTGMPTQFEAPSTADGYAKGIKAVQGVVRQQGQVMSMALENNQNLLNTNKRLKQELAQAKADLEHYTRKCKTLREHLERIPDEVLDAIVLRERNIFLEKAYAAMQDELTRQQMPELDTDQLQERLSQLKGQKDQLLKSGEVTDWVHPQLPVAELTKAPVVECEEHGNRCQDGGIDPLPTCPGSAPCEDP